MPQTQLSRLFLQAMRSAIAALLIAQLAGPQAVFGQPGVQVSNPPRDPTMGTEQTQGAAPAMGADQDSQAASKPIAEAPVAPMATMQATVAANTSPLTRDEQILQVLNRFTYGPRPGDLQRVRAMGLSKWFTEQFNPQRIDDSALDHRLADYPAMQLPLHRMMELYPNAQTIRAMINGRGGVPRGEGERAIYEAQMERYKDRRKNGNAAADTRDSDPAPLAIDAEAYLAMKPDARFNALCKLSPAQLRSLRQKLSQADRAALTEGFTPHQVEVIAAFNGPQGVVAAELVQTKLLRDIFSERQLNEIMVDFWLNHFNVYLRKSQEAPYFIAAFERDTIRPRAMGNFENLLVATAASPAMLNYLDNASSVGPHSPSVSPQVGFNRFGGMQRRPMKNASGLNENYARELMELHTLGVNGGYTQKDVTEVAKVFTGWTLGRGYDEGIPSRAEFDESKHEPGNKVVLGVKIKGNGSGEGLEVLHMLANSPQTARFISTKLAIRFVSDDPPKAMVDRMAGVFLETHGDIRHVLLAMIQSPEFASRESYRAKVKTPQDYVVSAVRAAGADVQSAGALAASISELGMPIYGMQTPNGYSMRADPWNNTAALISRMNFAVALSTNRVAGVHTDWPAVLDVRANETRAAGSELASLAPEEKDRLLEDHLLHLSVSNRTRETILGQINASKEQQASSLQQIASKNAGRDALSNLRAGRSRLEPAPTDPQTALAAGLLLGSPEFQRR